MITVTGATGNVGRGIVTRLREMGKEVRAVIPPGESAPWSAGGGLELVEASFEDAEAIARAAQEADAYFLMSPPHERQIEWQRTQITAAEKAGVRRVVKLSSYDSAPDSLWNMGRWHWDGELALQESGIPHTVLRPQYFHQNLLLNVDALRQGRMPTYIPPGLKVGAVAAQDIADVAAVLLTSAELTGQIVVPTGPEAITTADAAAAIAAALGIDVEIDYHDPDQAWKDLAARRPAWFIRDLINICQRASAEVNDTVPTLTGHPARSFMATARDTLEPDGTATS